MNEDIRWKQRFFNLKRAFAQLEKAVKKENLNELEQIGMIQCFEFTYELTWLTLKDYLQELGIEDFRGSRDTFRNAFSEGIIDSGHAWQKMVEVRNKTSHTYDQKLADEVEKEIRETYFDLLKRLLERLEIENQKA